MKRPMRANTASQQSRWARSLDSFRDGKVSTIRGHHREHQRGAMQTPQQIWSVVSCWPPKSKIIGSGAAGMILAEPGLLISETDGFRLANWYRWHPKSCRSSCSCIFATRNVRISFTTRTLRGIRTHDALNGFAGRSTTNARSWRHAKTKRRQNPQRP